MAEIEYARAEPPAPERASFSTLVNLAGAVMSLGLMVGVGVWGYKLLSRDVTGVPVVRALEGPMRVQPEDPGGQLADHQGLAVNDVAARGSAADPADRLMLAPQPVRLLDEDKPVAALAPAGEDLAVPSQTAVSPNADVAALVEQLTAGIEPVLEGDGREEVPVPVVAALEPKLMTDEDSAPEEDGAAVSETVGPGPEEDEVGIFVGPGLARSLRPVARPARAGDGAGVVLAAVEASEPALDLDPDSLPAGTRLAQLGAYDSPDVARSEWEAIYSRFPDYMQDKQRVIQMASSGGRVFYRLRVHGFADLSDARRFCAVLVAENAECIPVTTR